MNPRSKRRGAERRYAIAYRTSAEYRRTVKEGYCAGRVRGQSCGEGDGLVEAGWIDRRR